MRDLAQLEDRVRDLEACNLQVPQVDLQTRMFAHAGMGARTIFVPKGTTITGAKTNIANICVVSGDITVTTEDGPKRMTGFHVLQAGPGFKRAGYAHEDTWWTTIWPTALTDPKDMEDEMTAESDMLQTRREGIVYQQPMELEHGIRD